MTSSWDHCATVMTDGNFEQYSNVNNTISCLCRSAVDNRVGHHTISHWQRIAVPQTMLPPRADQERSDRRWAWDICCFGRSNSPFPTLFPGRRSDEQAAHVGKGAAFRHRRDGGMNENGLDEGRSILHRSAAGGHAVVQVLLYAGAFISGRESEAYAASIYFSVWRPDNDIRYLLVSPVHDRKVMERGLTGVMASMRNERYMRSQVFGSAQSMGLGEVRAPTLAAPSSAHI